MLGTEFHGAGVPLVSRRGAQPADKEGDAVPQVHLEDMQNKSSASEPGMSGVRAQVLLRGPQRPPNP